MTVEIKELVIKASVGDTAKKVETDADDAPDINNIVNRCVSQVLKIIERKKER